MAKLYEMGAEVIHLAEIDEDPSVVTARGVFDLYRELQGRGVQIAWWNADTTVISMELEYLGKHLELTIPVPDAKYGPSTVADQIVETFHLLLPEGNGELE